MSLKEKRAPEVFQNFNNLDIGNPVSIFMNNKYQFLV